MASQRPLLLLLFATSVSVMTTNAGCPVDCECTLDARGRKQVDCNQGGMRDPIPISAMDTDTEIIRITAPEHAPNEITIGPIFQQFARLEEIHIVESNVPAIGKHSFWGVFTLRILNLTRNNISHLLDSNFRGLIHLQELHLGDNQIESVPSACFRYVPELRILSLPRNHIAELVPRVFLLLGKLQSLDLSKNPLSELSPEVFKDVRELRELRCHGCGLSHINTLLYQLLPDLETLDLRNNHFKYIAGDEFKALKSLRAIHLDGNKLSVVLDRTFSGHSLQSLTLSHNRIAKLPQLALANASVRELDISYNKLDRLEKDVLQPLTESLRKLDVGGNPIVVPDLQSALRSPVRLRELGLADMKLTSLPLGMFVFHEHLKILNLSGNFFNHFEAQILAPVFRLQVLDLSRNQFRGLDDRLLTKLDHMMGLRTVYLQSNPWACDLCHITPMLAWLNRSAVAKDMCKADSDFRRKKHTCPVCEAPSLVSGHSINALDIQSLFWCGEENAAPNILPDDSRLGIIVAGVLAILLLAAIFLAALLYNRHAAQYYTNEEQRAEQEAIFENPATMDENGDIRFKDGVANKMAASITATKKKKKVSIATIDEITKDPDLSNHSPKLNGQGTKITNGT